MDLQQKNGSTDDDIPDPKNGTDDRNDTALHYLFTHPTVVHQLNTTTGHPHRRVKPSLTDLILDPQTTLGLHLFFTYFFSILALYMLHKNFHRFLARKQAFALARRESVPARTVLVTAIPEPLRDEVKLKQYFEVDCGWKVEGIRMVKNVGKELRQALHERELAMRGLEKAWWKYRGGKGLGQIRLPQNDDDDMDEQDPEIDDPEQQSRTPRQSSIRSRSSARNADVGLALSEEPNWGEVRREIDQHRESINGNDLERGTRLNAADGENPLIFDQHEANGSDRPVERVPKSTLQKVVPLLSDKVDAIDYWQDKFDAADAKVRTLRRIHGSPNSASAANSNSGRSTPEEMGPGGFADGDAEGHKEWQTTEEGFVTFEDIRDAVSKKNCPLDFLVHVLKPHWSFRSLRPKWCISHSTPSAGRAWRLTQMTLCGRTWV